VCMIDMIGKGGGDPNPAPENILVSRRHPKALGGIISFWIRFNPIGADWMGSIRYDELYSISSSNKQHIDEIYSISNSNKQYIDGIYSISSSNKQYIDEIYSISSSNKQYIDEIYRISNSNKQYIDEIYSISNSNKQYIDEIYYGVHADTDNRAPWRGGGCTMPSVAASVVVQYSRLCAAVSSYYGRRPT